MSFERLNITISDRVEMLLKGGVEIGFHMCLMIKPPVLPAE
jgi:hypothetical protein